MKKIFRRFVAYAIDMLVVLLITQCLSGIPQINKQLDDYNKYYNDYIELYQNYTSFYSDLSDAYEDKKIEAEEYNTLVSEHEGYVDVLNEYYIDGELTADNYEKLNTKISEEYEENYKEVYYNVEKNSIVYSIIYLVAVVAYFVLFNKYTNGQTLGKKLMRLKIVNSKDEGKDVPVWSYIVRTLILYQPIYYMVKLISINFMGMNDYYTVTNIVYEIQGYLEMLVIAMVMIRLDGRGPQDFLARTRVALYDKNGNEVQDKLNAMFTKKMAEVKNSSKKVIDEESLEKENTFLEQPEKKEIKTKKKTAKKADVSKNKKTKKVIDEESTSK